jgi:hypothetical protein
MSLLKQAKFIFNTIAGTIEGKSLEVFICHLRTHSSCQRTRSVDKTGKNVFCTHVLNDIIG